MTAIAFTPILLLIWGIIKKNKVLRNTFYLLVFFFGLSLFELVLSALFPNLFSVLWSSIATLNIALINFLNPFLIGANNIMWIPTMVVAVIGTIALVFGYARFVLSNIRKL